jgi:hypothetical protein
MLAVRTMEPAEAATLFCESPPLPGMTPTEWELCCGQPSFLALVAEWDGGLAGFAIAESHPQKVQVLTMAGSVGTCRVLLGRLVKRAGERDISVWCPIAHSDLLEMIEGMGFALQIPNDFEGRMSFLYHPLPA